MCASPLLNEDVGTNPFLGNFSMTCKVRLVLLFAQYLLEDASSQPVSLHLVQLKQVSTHTGCDVSLVENISA